MAEPAFTKMIIASDTSEMARVQQAVLDAAQAHGFAEREVFGIRLALEEGLPNAIHHGNQDDPDKQVAVEYRIHDGELTVHIRDEGGGFRPDNLPDPRDEENLTRPHGRGVLLMQAYMNEVSFNEAGNVVTLVKRRGEAVQNSES
jgi:serine/threonine-protein kinase RsbW